MRTANSTATFSGVASSVPVACFAGAAFERTLELEPLHVPALRDLALLVEKSGDEKAALDLWRRVKRSASPRDEKFTQEVDAKIAALQARVEKTQAPPANAKPAPKG